VAVTRERTQDLLLLLSMAGLSAGCSRGVDLEGFTGTFGPSPTGMDTEGDDDDDDDDDNDAESSSGDDDRDEDDESTSTTSPVDPTLPPTTGPAPTTGPPPSTTTGEPVTTGVSASGPDLTTTGGGYYGNPCPDYADWAYDCYLLYDGLEYCYYVIDFYYTSYGATCAAAVAEVFACLSEQVCMSVDCDAEISAYQSVC
jgi:hypothetical protein